MFNKEEFDNKRKREFDFFIEELRKLGAQGLRPHQAYRAIVLKIEEKLGRGNVDTFYWEGVYGQDFDYDKADGSSPEEKA